ncbi:MAG TPA: hypothetical protein VFZ97_13250 [Acidimicrobiales bacterium]
MADAVILLVVIAMVWGLYIQAIVMAARRPDFAYRAIGRTKPGTVAMILLTGFIGGLYFLLRIRPSLLAAERAIPAGSLPPADTDDIKQWRRTRDPWS